MQKRIVSVLAVAFLALLALTGCGYDYDDVVNHGYTLDTDTKVTVIQMGPDWVDVATFCNNGNRVYIDGNKGDISTVPNDPSC